MSASLVIYAARSTKGILRLSSVDRALVTIPDDLKDVLVGILLGDGLVRIIMRFALLPCLFSFLLWDITMSIEDTLLALDSSPVLGLMPIPGFKPILSYSDPETEKAAILAENRGKSGIYV
jgi:hypothetical protein